MTCSVRFRAYVATVATLCLVGLVPFSAAKEIKPGVERWPIKTSVPANAVQRKVPLSELLKFPDPPDVRHNDARYQAPRIPPFDNPLGLKEGDAISTNGWLHLVAGESDGDYHIQVSDSPTSGDHCIVVEVPSGDPAFVKSAALQLKVERVRAFIRDKLLRGKEPSSAGSVMQHPVYVTIVGQLFYDDAHVGDPPRGKKGMHAANLWELHPVTDIAFAPPPGQ